MKLLRWFFVLPGFVAATAMGANLNDSGQTACFDGKGVSVDCMTFQDDGSTGRDASFRVGSLKKQGGGRAGFDFTKIANDGSTLPASAELGSKPGDWACTRDNVTGLTWEIKTALPGDLRHMDGRYNWLFDEASSKKDASPAGICDAANVDACQTIGAYADAVNRLGLCGHSDWRVSEMRELLSLLDYGATSGALIDKTYFPNTAPAWHWVRSAYALGAGAAWDIDFGKGLIGVGNLGTSYAVRLVRTSK